MNNELKIEQVPVEQLIPAEYNPRFWSENARKGLTKSLEEFGFVQPIVVNSAPERRGVIVGGNFKLDIAKKKGIKTLPVVWVNLDLKREKELNLRLNKNQGDFDLELLADFDPALLAEVGFDSKELDKIFDTDDDDFDGDKEAEAIVTPTSKLGEIYEIGKHRIGCLDSASLADVEKLMGGGRADMVFVDPPYNVAYSGRGKKTSNTILNDSMSEQNFRAMLTAWFASLKYASKKDALNSNGYEVRNQIIWVKKVASMGWGDYRWKHEPILYCHQKDAKTNFYGDRKQYTEWSEEPSDEELLKTIRAQVKKEEAGDSTVWRLHREMKYDHPTQKPIKLVSIAIRNSSIRDDLILDLFGGSFSTMVAANQLNRVCYSCDLDPRYVDVGIKRMLKLDPTLELKMDGKAIDKTPWLK